MVFVEFCNGESRTISLYAVDNNVMVNVMHESVRIHPDNSTSVNR